MLAKLRAFISKNKKSMGVAAGILALAGAETQRPKAQFILRDKLSAETNRVNLPKTVSAGLGHKQSRMLLKMKPSTVNRLTAILGIQSGKEFRGIVVNIIPENVPAAYTLANAAITMPEPEYRKYLGRMMVEFRVRQRTEEDRIRKTAFKFLKTPQQYRTGLKDTNVPVAKRLDPLIRIPKSPETSPSGELLDLKYQPIIFRSFGDNLPGNLRFLLQSLPEDERANVTNFLHSFKVEM